MKTIGEVAELAGVTVKSLRHYDRIDLLKPRARSDAGYRLYGREELERLREILIWRRLGFPLADISALLDDPGHDRGEALRRQLELAGSQLVNFHALTRGLELAVKAVDDGRSLAEDELFEGFARSLADDDSEGREAPVRRVATFALLSGRSHHGTADGLAGDRPARVVATDPIRMADSLLALGIVPVGAWSYPDRFGGRERDQPGASGSWPWSPFVEPIVRRRIGDLGIYGGDPAVVESLRPDVIFGWPAVQSHGLGAVAPLEVLDFDPHGSPGFRTWLPELAARLGLESRVERLLASWDARTLAFRPHLEGKEIASLNVFGDVPGGGLLFFVTTDDFEAQVFTDVGLTLTRVADGSGEHWAGREIDLCGVADLDAPTLFLGTFHVERERVAALLSSQELRRLRATRLGRVHGLDWNGVRSGWFGSHWQLQLIASAFGLTQLRAGDVFAVVDPAAGRVEITSLADADAVLTGLDLPDCELELRVGRTTSLALAADLADKVCRLPEAYGLSLAGDAPLPLARDRESALLRIAGAHEPVDS